MTARQQSKDTLRVIGLVAVTGVLVFLGIVSVVNRLHFEVATDGVSWAVRDGAFHAASVVPGGPGDEAGIEVGDRLVEMAGNVARPDQQDFPDSVLWPLIPGDQINYVLERGGDTVDASVIVDQLDLDNRVYIYLCIVGFASLIAGVFVLMRRREAEAGAHGQMSGVAARFFWLALAFYAAAVLFPTRPEDPFNGSFLGLTYGPIVWVDQLARNLLPGLFLYFALTFPRPKPHFKENRTAWLFGIFAPGVALFFSWALLLEGAEALRLAPATFYPAAQLLNNIDLVYFAVALGLGLVLIAHSYRATESPIERRRLTWLIGGTAIAFFPFVAIYVPLYILGFTHPLLELTVLPFVAIPICFGYAAVGFRLWDVEVILKTALAYSITALAVLGMYVGAERLIRLLIDEEIAVAGAFLATLIVAMLFAPLRDRIHDGLDRLYYRERYRSRRGILDFTRELNTELDLGQVVALLVQRVRKMVAVGRIAVLLKEEDGSRMRLVSNDGSMIDGPQLSNQFSKFLGAALVDREFMYIEDLSTLLEEFPEDREMLAEEDLAYFLPLVVKGEVLGLLALGHTLTGDYLSSEDLKVLQMLTSHAALALDNALLYRQAHARAQEFEQLKNYNENIVQSIKVGVMVVDTDGRVRSWNRSMEQTLGIRANEAIRKHVDELFPATFAAALQQARHRIEVGNELLASAYRVALRTADNVDRVVNISVAPLLGERGHQPSVVIVDDVTDATELESQLRQSDRLASVGLLAAGVAHEVNTPLAGISSYVQMMQRKMPESDPRRPILEKIEKQTFRASSIVNNLLNFSRQQASDMQPVNMNTVVEETLTLAELPLSKRKVRVATELAETLAPVWGDTGKLQQVLMNLVLNARDSMPDGGDLNIRTAQQNGEVILEVADTGSGIPREQIHKIYDPFFTTKGTGKGTGLGLSVTYGIVQEHRGTITVRSETGNGTVFRVALPAAAQGRARAAS
jgi:PAS domain S-box-containing protein